MSQDECPFFGERPWRVQSVHFWPWPRGVTIYRNAAFDAAIAEAGRREFPRLVASLPNPFLKSE